MNSRNLLYILTVTILLVAFLFIMINSASEITVTSSSLQISKTPPTIIIDAGHGGEDGGAVSDSGVVEKDINLLIANNTSDLLNILGFDTIKTRDNDISLATEESTIRLRKVADMKKRLEIFNSSDNNVILSIHQNKFTDSKYYGTQIFYSPNNKYSSLLAEKIKFTVKQLLQPSNERECKKAGSEIYLLKNTYNPAVIVECGFLSNSNECNKLTDNIYQKQIAYSIATGFLDYYNTSDQEV